MENGINCVSIPKEVTVSDDWLCLDGSPVSDLHFWGSYLSRNGQEHWEDENSGPPSNLLPAHTKH